MYIGFVLFWVFRHSKRASRARKASKNCPDKLHILEKVMLTADFPNKKKQDSPLIDPRLA